MTLRLLISYLVIFALFYLCNIKICKFVISNFGPVYIYESDVTYGQVWWPILGICPLHLTHPDYTHTAVNTHSEHTRSCGARGAVGGSVPCSRVSPQSWYWWVERALYIHSLHLHSCRTWDSNSQPFDYESDSLTIRPRLPLYIYIHTQPNTHTYIETEYTNTVHSFNYEKVFNHFFSLFRPQRSQVWPLSEEYQRVNIPKEKQK